ncbi:uncharacterized protein LOC127868474 isoform X3 [Dreissena polymorpha]|uniref:JmjC domain-containing protein n=2 Tax=Dreissena polymorpha TaxID=45954 RepID=A0A9D4MIL5_DREPO|nr:uncharacterized protein LOC127868474 isoform X3 [Dreissena polymorpha]XP_052266272.1 uncharacterized protein LOC127868474 isoform X3 [Dreissena polymorpha]XP_052266281.1 uncharacterized protein LOC127868474 isoform X3 [Dreissena polymorpha]XP_052266290.1 uncharacterized protein LOC127868474 isoform X3 [Dreissena polymorpha]XP_052266298.1 uncharacterized protein LOC127868474 isoform X3 [Dreissena polymorpha]XP_052266306.1 uncharacterized protein LOC127868474 isoform X3 [Dreissena polymorpha]
MSKRRNNRKESNDTHNVSRQKNNTAKESKKNLKSGSSFDHLKGSSRHILLCIITVIVAVIAFKFHNSFIGHLDNVDISKRNTTSANNGGWRVADEATLNLYNSDLCTVERVKAESLTVNEFERIYRYKKPLIVQFKNGADDWIESAKWTLNSLKEEYGGEVVHSGNARDIVRHGGNGYVETSFTEYVDKLMSDKDQIGEPYYVFDRLFYNGSYLTETLRPPNYFEIKDGVDDSIFFLGSSGSGVSFHKHADAWNGVVFGRKRWFLYPVEQTPPGGVYPGYTMREWIEHIYPTLTAVNRPIECIQEPGEILYLPESTYHGTVNLGDTIALGIQKKEAVTTVEKLFYDEHKLAQSMRGVSQQTLASIQQKKLQIMKEISGLIPNNAEVHMKLGDLYKDIGELDKAVEHLNAAIKIDPLFLVAIMNLAGIKTKMHDFVKAEELYRHALVMNPKLWDVYAQYGDFLMMTNRAQEAVAIYRKGTELEPNTLAFWSNLRQAQDIAGDHAGARSTQKVIDKLNRKLDKHN